MEVSRTPTDDELLELAITSFLAGVHTSMPGKVVTYFPETQKADIKPLLKTLTVHGDGSELVESIPIIPDVPIHFMRAAGFAMTFPLEPGDLVCLHFAESSIDNYLSSQGDDSDPDDFRKHDLSDAIAVPGFYPFTKSIGDISSVNMVMGKTEGGIQIHLTPNGTMELKFDGEADEAVALGNALQLFWDNVFKPVFDMHIHSTPSGPSGPPLTPLLATLTAPSFDPSIISKVFKLKK